MMVIMIFRLFVVFFECRINIWKNDWKNFLINNYGHSRLAT
uniref:Uncharacterized protein n=1 Tax=virus sp. ctkyY8 TaxID=2827995 RepID=A0A8S5RDT1_9VIRU|nr:MAG TPA: hypothetical protein [virus sp. ctkyY8]